MNTFDPVAWINEPRWQNVKPGLERIVELMALVGNPEQSLRYVHVAGTNGKGSTSAFIAKTLTGSRYKTGLFTSPYIFEFAERIRIDGRNIPADDLRRVAWQVHEVVDCMSERPTEFELMTAVALTYFAEQSCDVVVLEVGLGGRLDSTNCIPAPEVAVITPIAIDHAAILGSSLEEIATEKAGIIKPGSMVVSAPQASEVREVLDATFLKSQLCLEASPDTPSGLRVSALRNCDASLISQFLRLRHSPSGMSGEATNSVQEPASIAYVEPSFVVGSPDNFSIGELDGLSLRMNVEYQQVNAATAALALQALEQKAWHISWDAFRNVLKTEQNPGRFEVVSEDPLLVVDGGHNPQGALMLADELAKRGDSFTFVFGALADKDIEHILNPLLPLAGRWILYPPPNVRAENPERVAELIRAGTRLKEQEDRIITCVDSLDDALALGKEFHGQGSPVVFSGSLYSVGEILQQLSYL